MAHEFRADLHCHTTFSDGTSSVEELLDLACEVGLKGLSITDHDTIDAYPAALELAKARGLKLLSGVEFSARHKEESVHILAYGFSLSNPCEIAKLCAHQCELRAERNRAICERLKKECYITLELQSKEMGSLGRPHIALKLLEQGIVTSVAEAFERYLGEGKKAYVPGCYPTVEAVIEEVHRGGAKAVLAHPHLISKKRMLKELCEMNFDGIEVYYGTFNRDQERRFLEIAQKKQWIATGGSDFHGSVKPYQKLGVSYVDEQTFNQLAASL